LSCFQSNHEGALIDRIHAAGGGVDAIVINPGGLTHTSVALRDAGRWHPVCRSAYFEYLPARAFRHHSFLSACNRTICGLGIEGYRFAIDFVLKSDNLRDLRAFYCPRHTHSWGLHGSAS
jgi:3-dehydroquinate dehydratase-2